MPAVSGLAEEFPGRVRVWHEDATTPEGRQAVERLGFKSHGLVVRSSRGDVLWRQADHQVNVDEARAALRRLLEG